MMYAKVALPAKPQHIKFGAIALVMMSINLRRASALLARFRADQSSANDSLLNGALSRALVFCYSFSLGGDLLAIGEIVCVLLLRNLLSVFGVVGSVVSTLFLAVRSVVGTEIFTQVLFVLSAPLSKVFGCFHPESLASFAPAA